jgi:hypothetical protein
LFRFEKTKKDFINYFPKLLLIFQFCDILRYIKGVIYLAEFCTCGSLIINEQCTNKNCTNKPASKSASPKHSSAKEGKKETKSTRTRRASKVITYNLYEDKNEDGNE